MRNVEIKGKLRNPNFVLGKLKELNKDNFVVIKQEDTFFKVPKGRLKLRQFEDNTAELIYYERPNIAGPKLCDFKKLILNAADSSTMKEILFCTNEIIGVVKKTRKLYMIDQTRVHIDEVERLGHFIELEVVLENDQSVETGEEIALHIMKELDIKKEDLISTAYIDLLSVS